MVDDKRRRVLDAALRTFAERGYHGTAVPEVAKAAGVGIGTLYRYFENKDALVNEVYRDAKLRLRAALLDGLPALDSYQLDSAQRWFFELWRRLAAFARAEPEAFRFLEMQDHAPYLDRESRELELSVLAPLWHAGKRVRDRMAGPAVDVTIALLWGAFVGLVKASRLGYLSLDDRALEEAGRACWRLIAAEPARASSARASIVSKSARASSARASIVSRSARASSARASIVSRSARGASARASLASKSAPASSARASLASKSAPASSARVSLASKSAPATSVRASTVSKSARAANERTRRVTKG